MNKSKVTNNFILEYDEFYPTPETLITKMLAGIQFDKVFSVLEPSAGKGDIVDVVSRRLSSAHWRRSDTDGKDMIDCIEIQPDLQHILTGNGYRVVHNDFLTFHTHKHYDLIVMNPPFSNGDMHLMKALDLVKEGGTVVCILNAETLRNSYTNLRKTLLTRLEALNASIEYVQDAFVKSERKTDVEIAIVKVTVPVAERTSFFFEDLKQKKYAEYKVDCTDLVAGDFIAQIVKQYEIEAEAGIRLIKEYKAMLPYIRYSFDKENCSDYPTLELNLRDVSKYSSNHLDINGYVALVRMKYWDALFRNKTFTGMLTSNLQSDLYYKVQTLKDYDFSVFNIRQIQEQIMNLLSKGVEDTILDLFDKLSQKHSWYPESENNIHYYSGWATNKAHKINKKVIIPINGAFSSYSWKTEAFEVYPVYNIIRDIEKALNYLDNGETECPDDLNERLIICAQNGTTKKIPLKYFTITLYKKGTCHIEFTNMKLLDKLNIYGSQHKGWLPPSYGKKAYSDMNSEEKSVIDEFQGEKAYNQVMACPSSYIIETRQMLCLTDGN